jgi:O-antigen ligase
VNLFFHELLETNEVQIKKLPQLESVSWLFFLLVGFIALIFLMGGSARLEVQSLVILRPVAVLVLGIGIFNMQRQHLRDNVVLVGFAAAFLAVLIVQTIPLPLPSTESVTAGIFEQVRNLTGNQNDSHPVTVTPRNTLNSLFALAVPLAVLVIGCQLGKEERFLLLPVLLIFCLLSGILGLLQILGGGGSFWYFYDITNDGSVVGFFANRNHQAFLLAFTFPMMAVYVSAGVRSYEQYRFRLLAAIFAGILLIPLILITGSRAGLVIAFLAICSVPILFRSPNFPTARKSAGALTKWRAFAVPGGVVALVVLTIFMARGEAISRLLAADQDEDLRFAIWQPISQAAQGYLPFGSGIGSFPSLYQVIEPDALLFNNYVNQAHNDWVDILLTASLLGLVPLLVFGVFLLARFGSIARNWSDRSRTTAYQRLGAVIILMFAVASATDYPVRTPIGATIFVVTLLWVYSIASERSQQPQA